MKRFDDKRIVAGCDEVGRGSLAGPVVAAAVILPLNFDHAAMDDSKKLSAKRREELRKYIENKALSYSIEMVKAPVIDQINILQASFRAMHKALDYLIIRPEFTLIDGNRFIPYKNLPHQCVIKGDSKFSSIAAASILAKTYRDMYMRTLDKEFPMYHWNKNKGYGTLEHRNAVMKHGGCKYHRMSFKPLRPDLFNQPKINEGLIDNED